MSKETSVSALSQKTSTHPVSLGFKLLLMSVICFSVMSMTIITPALPGFVNYFDISKDTAQQISSVIFLGGGLSGIIYGPLSDSFGRKAILLFSIAMFTFISFACIFAPTIEVFMVLQFLQGLHAGTGSVVTLAIVKDSFDGPEASKVIGGMGTIIPFAPGGAPIIGGYLTAFSGWQSIYLFLSFISVSLFLLCWFYMPEIHKKENRTKFTFRAYITIFFHLFKNKQLMRYSCILGMGFAALHLYYITSAFMFINHMSVEKQHLGYYQLFSISGVVFGNLIVNRFVMRHGVVKMLKAAPSFFLPGALLFTVGTALTLKEPLFYAFATFACAIALGIIFSTTMPLGMACSGKNLGYSSALLRLVQMMSAFITTAVVAELYNQTFWPTALTILTFAILITILAKLPHKEVSV